MSTVYHLSESNCPTVLYGTGLVKASLAYPQSLADLKESRWGGKAVSSAWWFMPATPALGGRRQEDRKFKATLNHTVSLYVCCLTLQSLLPPTFGVSLERLVVWGGPTELSQAPSLVCGQPARWLTHLGIFPLAGTKQAVSCFLSGSLTQSYPQSSLRHPRAGEPPSETHTASLSELRG